MVTGVYRSAGARSINEDSAILEHVRTSQGECALLAVCDGIGSLDHGEVVSGYVAECLVRWFYRQGVSMKRARKGRIRRSLFRCMYDCHMELKEYAAQKGIRWGTTCTCVCIWGRRYVCLHVGDSAAYITGRETVRITSSHTDEKGRLIRCMGSMGYYFPDIRTGRIPRGSGIVVASDGFLEKFTENELADMLNLPGVRTSDRIEKRLASIGAEAAGRGGTDNRSAVCLFDGG